MGIRVRRKNIHPKGVLLRVAVGIHWVSEGDRFMGTHG